MGLGSEVKGFRAADLLDTYCSAPLHGACSAPAEERCAAGSSAAPPRWNGQPAAAVSLERARRPSPAAA